MSAWVEVEASDGKSWFTIPSTAFNPTQKPVVQPLQQPQPKDSGKIVPPPAQGRAKTIIDDGSSANGAPSGKASRASSSGGGIPAWVTSLGTYGGPPVLLIVALCALIIGAKTTRRNRRRTRGTPAERLAHGWREVLDHARDLGASVRGGYTRGEYATLLAPLGVSDLARLADSSVFGPAIPTDQDAAGYWEQVDQMRKRQLSELSLLRRIRAKLSLASFRKLRTDSVPST